MSLVQQRKNNPINTMQKIKMQGTYFCGWHKIWHSLQSTVLCSCLPAWSSSMSQRWSFFEIIVSRLDTVCCDAGVISVSDPDTLIFWLLYSYLLWTCLIHPDSWLCSCLEILHLWLRFCCCGCSHMDMIQIWTRFVPKTAAVTIITVLCSSQNVLSTCLVSSVPFYSSTPL